MLCADNQDDFDSLPSQKHVSQLARPFCSPARADLLYTLLSSRGFQRRSWRFFRHTTLSHVFCGRIVSLGVRQCARTHHTEFCNPQDGIVRCLLPFQRLQIVQDRARSELHDSAALRDGHHGSLFHSCVDLDNLNSACANIDPLFSSFNHH